MNAYEHEIIQATLHSQGELIKQQAKRIEELEKEKDGCGNCHACLVEVMENGFPKIAQRMILCPDCGNKRCPKASNHRYKCTGSNEVGQHGSIYTAPRELSDEEIKKCVIAWVKQIYGNEYVTPSDSHIINGTKLIRLAEKRIFKNDSL